MQIFHGGQRSRCCLRYLGAAEVQIGELRQRSELGKAVAGNLVPSRCSARRCVNFQRVEARVGHGCAPKLGLDNVRRELLELRQLRVAEATRGIDGVEDQPVGRLARDGHQLRALAFSICESRASVRCSRRRAERRVRLRLRESRLLQRWRRWAMRPAESMLDPCNLLALSGGLPSAGMNCLWLGGSVTRLSSKALFRIAGDDDWAILSAFHQLIVGVERRPPLSCFAMAGDAVGVENGIDVLGVKRIWDWRLASLPMVVSA
jgi:hypothetical protein